MHWKNKTYQEYGLLEMSYRFMRVVVLFDLPVGTQPERREYARFRRFLLKNGFMMLQESVYCKLALNATAANAIHEYIRKNKPKHGLVQMLTITEKQFAKMEMLTGDFHSDMIDSDERLLIL